MTATAERLDQLLHRPLGGQRWLVVFLDGLGWANICWLARSG